MTRKWGKFKDAQGRHWWVRMDEITMVQPPEHTAVGMPTAVAMADGRSLQAFGVNALQLMRDLTTIDKRAALTDYTGGDK